MDGTDMTILIGCISFDTPPLHVHPSSRWVPYLKLHLGNMKVMDHHGRWTYVLAVWRASGGMQHFFHHSDGVDEFEGFLLTQQHRRCSHVGIPNFVVGEDCIAERTERELGLNFEDNLISTEVLMYGVQEVCKWALNPSQKWNVRVGGEDLIFCRSRDIVSVWHPALTDHDGNNRSPFDVVCINMSCGRYELDQRIPFVTHLLSNASELREVIVTSFTERYVDAVIH
jgi:hypothetical protein